MTRFLKGTDRPLAEAYQLALLDLDGVVYRGKNPVEYAADSIRAAEAAGMTIEYTTNNSSRFQHVVADQLKGFGLDVEPWQVITSSVVAARMVAKALPAGARVQVLGAEHLRDEVTRNGLTIVDGPQDRPQAVIQGWYPDMTWQMMADAAFAVEAGVVYRGKNPVEHAAESIRKAEGLGMTVEYTTNNSSRLQSVVADQLKGFDLDVEPWQVITSSVVAARMVARAVPQGAKVFVLGAQHLREEVAKQGLEVVDSAEDKPVAAIQGWYPDMSWNQMAQIAYAVEQGATYFVTNRDLTIPRELGIAPGCGSMIRAVITATGVEPVASAGKPEAYMYDEARELNAAEGHDLVPKEASIAIGDRLDTDIEAGNRGDYDSLAVLTGVTNPILTTRA